jgi:hypothetical protein
MAVRAAEGVMNLNQAGRGRNPSSRNSCGAGSGKWPCECECGGTFSRRRLTGVAMRAVDSGPVQDNYKLVRAGQCRSRNIGYEIALLNGY